MSVFTKITDFLGGSVVSEVKDLVMEYIPSKEKKQELELKLKEFEQKKVMEAKTLELELEKEITERTTKFQDTEQIQLQQEDKWTKRARPTRQYFWLLFFFICIVAAVITGKFIDLPEPIYWIIGTDLGVYTIARTSEKMGVNPLNKINPFKTK